MANLRRTIGLGVLAVLLCASLGFVGFYFVGLPVGQARLAKLKPGMSKNEVQRLLGKPVAMSSITDGSMWVYESPFHFFAIEIFFDWQGQYTKHWKD
jgi:outer membrane protein assembly factor BamE (lipoprotein component of BamABCDE complex)